MISAFAKGAQVLGEPRYAQAARQAREFVRSQLWRASDATLLRRYRDGEAAIEGFLDDYANMIKALVDLYETEFELSDLEWAEQLAARALELFEDPVGGGFFSTAEVQSGLVLRLKDDYDGAEPSGNSAMALALLRLARLRDREDFRRAAARTLEAFGARLSEAGSGLPQMLVADLFARHRPAEIVLAGPRRELEPMLAEVRRRFLPNAVVLLGEHAPRPMPDAGGHAVAYVCENYACHLPAASAAALAETLQ